MENDAILEAFHKILDEPYLGNLNGMSHSCHWCSWPEERDAEGNRTQNHYSDCEVEIARDALKHLAYLLDMGDKK